MLAPKHVDHGRRMHSIDVGGPARMLRFLRAADFVLVIVCGSWAIRILAELTFLPAEGPPVPLGQSIALAIVLLVASFVGWRHVGVIEPAAWGYQLAVLPSVMALVVATHLPLPNLIKALNEDYQLRTLLIGPPLAIAAALVLRWLRVGKLTIPALVAALHAREPRPRPDLGRVRRVAPLRGSIAAGIGALLVLVGAVAPPVGWLGFTLLARARRYFQYRADSLLGVDKRPPILFLRSFDDDRVRVFGSRALIDLSLEIRLANHFMQHGPFIAIGSPNERVPRAGAARMLLSDDEWQAQVQSWMQEASAIVLYAGATPWVKWELEQALSRHAGKLILVFPDSRRWLPWRRVEDEARRVAATAELLAGTPWGRAFEAACFRPGSRAVLFRPEGRLLVVRGSAANRDCHHLAVMVAHHELLSAKLEGAAKPHPRVTHLPRARRVGEARAMRPGYAPPRRRRALFIVLYAIAILGGATGVASVLSVGAIAFLPLADGRAMLPGPRNPSRPRGRMLRQDAGGQGS